MIAAWAVVLMISVIFHMIYFKRNAGARRLIDELRQTGIVKTDTFFLVNALIADFFLIVGIVSFAAKL